MKLARLSVVLIASVPVFAQSDLFDKAPPQVDESLRSRVMIYYNAQVTAKYSDAFKVVAADAQDEFLAAQKDNYKSCEISKINYTDNFTKATATTACKGELTWHGRHVPVTIPLVSTWKIVDGQWFWYHIRETSVDSPFGTLATVKDASGTGQISALPADPAALAESILKGVQIDRSEVQLNGWEVSKADVHITNKMPGSVQVSVDRIPMNGLNYKIDKPELAQGEVATITFTYDPKDPSIPCGSCTLKVVFPPATALVKISPTSQQFPVTVNFAVPTELQKKLPKSSKN